MRRGPGSLACLWLFRVALVLPPVIILVVYLGVRLTAGTPQQAQSGEVALMVLAVPLAGLWLLAVPLLGLLAWLTRARPPTA